jgi:hypothetical protein
LTRRDEHMKRVQGLEKNIKTIMKEEELKKG